MPKTESERVTESERERQALRLLGQRNHARQRRPSSKHGVRCHFQLRRSVSFQRHHLQRRISRLVEGIGSRFQTHLPSSQFPRGRFLPHPGCTLQTLRRAPKNRQCIQDVVLVHQRRNTLCSKTRRCASSECPCPPSPEPLDSLNRRKVSNTTFSTRASIKTTLDSYPTGNTTIPEACTSHQPKNSNGGMRNKIPSASLISNPNSWPIANLTCCY